MKRFQQYRLALMGAAIALCTGTALASAYDESVNGDLANTAATEGSLTLGYDSLHGALGSNPIQGTFGVQSGVNDRDFLKIIVPDGYQLSALVIGASTVIGGEFSFVALAPGSGTGLPSFDASMLLGYTHFGESDVGMDVLPNMSIAGGTQQFTVPLAAGTYTLWIQETSTGVFGYQMNLMLTPVPEPATTALLLAGLLAGLPLLRRRRGA